MRSFALAALGGLAVLGAVAIGVVTGRGESGPSFPPSGAMDGGVGNTVGAEATLTPFVIPPEGGAIPAEVVAQLGQEGGPDEIPFEIPAPASSLGTELPPDVHEAVARVSLEEAVSLHGRPDVLFLDVRFPHEYEQGHVQGAAVLPVSEVEARLAQIPKDLEIITYCA